jgi:hypothetical protein
VAPVIVPETNKPEPETKTPDKTVKLPLIVWSPAKVWLMAVKNWKTPLVKFAFPPVTVWPETRSVNMPLTPVITVA